MFDILIFDLDGTLFDTAPDVHQCCNYTLTQMNLSPISLAQAKLAIGPGPDNFACITLGADNVHRYEDFIGIFRKHYRDHCFDNTSLFPGIDEMLTSLGGKKLAVATNKPCSFTIPILEKLGQRARFDLVVGPEDVKQLKPKPDMIFYVMDKLGGSPDTTLMIGDTDNDILAARAAGVASCAVGWGYALRSSVLKNKPNYFIEHPSELVSIVKNGKLE